jgi:molybdopterin converting factor small subunit
MEIRFYANLRTLVGQPFVDVADPGVDTLLKLFERLIEIYPEMRPHLLDERAGLRQDVPIFVNGRNPRLTEAGIHVHLQPDDVISLFSPISSGKMNVEVMREPTFGKQM